MGQKSPIKIVRVIVENSVSLKVKLPFRGEHGLSMLLETASGLFLYDTGQTDLVLHNLALFKIRPCDIEGIILSHGHYDHSGGLSHVLTSAQKKMPVYLHPLAFTQHCSVSTGKKRFNGIPVRREKLESLGADFHFVEEPFQLQEGLWVSGSVPRNPHYEQRDKNLFICQEGQADVPDVIQDDMSLFSVTDKGVVVLSGCAHAGMINTINYAFKTTGCNILRGFIGGTHLNGADEQQRKDAISELQRYSVEFMTVGHCTGDEAFSLLHQQFGSTIQRASVGTTIQLG